MLDKTPGNDGDEANTEENNQTDAAEGEEDRMFLYISDVLLAIYSAVYTGAEIVQAMDERDQVDRMLYGSQDETVCTWPEVCPLHASLYVFPF